jgi:hypothetical protein
LSYALMLVDPTGTSSSVGRLYRLQGAVGRGLELLISEGYDVTKRNSCTGTVTLFLMPNLFLERFESIFNQTKYLPQLLPLIPTNSGLTANDGTGRKWIVDILHSARTQLYDADLLPDVMDV